MFLDIILKSIYPLSLREKIFYRTLSKFHFDFPSSFESVSLEFASQIHLKLQSTDVGHKSIAFCGFYELVVTRRIVALAKQGGLFVDVGANYGYYSCLWAANNSENRVIAFEASPRNISPLQDNIINNQLQSQVEIHDVALGREIGNLPFNFMSNEQTGWGGLVLESQTNTINVPVITLDSFMADSNPDQIIDVLKIDTEGADTWVLQGASQLLQEKRIKHIFFEENKVRMSALGISSETVKELLTGYGYQLTQITKGEFYATIINH